MTTKIIGEYKAEDIVPEWMFYANPVNTKSVPPVMAFCVDASVVEVDDIIWIIPKEVNWGGAILKIVKGSHLEMGALYKSIAMPLSVHYVISPDMQAIQQQGPQGKESQ
jgi:hypothetical protein